MGVGSHIDQENNTCQSSGAVEKVTPSIPSLDQARGNASVPKRGELANVRRVKEKAEKKSIRKIWVKSSTKQQTLRSLVRCKCCAFMGSGSALLNHLFIHYSAQMKERYQKDLDANRCPECGFSSSSTDSSDLKRNMLRHIGVIHKKILEFMEI